MTFPRADRDLLMFAPSFRVAPDAPVDLARSDPMVYYRGGGLERVAILS